MKKIFALAVFSVFLIAANCDNKLFSLHVVNSVKLKTLLSDIVNQSCMNVIFKDQTILKKSY